MKKKNKIIVITITLIIFMLSFIVINISQMYSEKKEVISNDKSVIKQDTISMMYETEAGSGEYVISSSNTWPVGDYVVNSELSGCENGGALTWNETTRKVILKTNTSDKCYVYFDVKVEETVFFADYIKSLYTTQGANGIYYHDFNLSNSLVDYSYRYSGGNPSNYVCFGTNATPCPADNLYRIIAVIGNNVKLIKNTSLGYYLWTGDENSNSNRWSNSNLNIITLNGTYLNGLGTWGSLIAITTWQVGGVDWSTTMYPDQYYEDESNTGLTHPAKIGLMYIYEYAYAADNGWGYRLNTYNNYIDDNWMFYGEDEWTMSPRAETANYVHTIGSNGKLSNHSLSYGELATRPVFNLTDSVKYIRGNGSPSEPYRIG